MGRSNSLFYRRLGLGAAVTVHVYGAAWAQPEHEQHNSTQIRVAQADPDTTLRLSGQLELPRLADVVADRLKLSLDYDPAVLKGSVLLRLESPLSDEELWALFNRLLAARGFTTVRVGGVGRVAEAANNREARELAGRSFTVVRLADAAGAAELDVRGARPGPGDIAQEQKQARNGAPKDGAAAGVEIPAGFVSQVIRVEHISLKDASEAIGKVLSKPSGSVIPLGDQAGPGGAAGVGGGSGGAGGAGGVLIVTDLSSRVQSAMDLLRLIDVPGPAVLVTEVPVHNVSPAAMQTLLAQVVAKRDAVMGRKLGGDVLLSPSGNGLLVIATRSQLEGTAQEPASTNSSGWRSLIESLDHREPVETLTYTPRTFGVKEVSKLIEESVHATSSTSGVAAGANASTGGGSDDRWRMVTDELTGSLVIRATPSQHEQIRQLIERLDSVPTAARRPVRSFVIKNRPVKEIRAILDQLVQSGVLAGSGSVEMGATPSGGPSTSSPGITPAMPAAFGAPAAIVPGGAASAGASAPATGATASPGAPSNASSPPGTAAAAPAQGPASTFVGPAPSSRFSGPGWGGWRGDGGRGNDNQRGAGEPRLVLASDDATNTLIAMGEARVVEQVEALLPSLDVRQAQVMLEVLIVSLTDDQTLSLGVELDKLVKSGDTSIRLSSLFGIGTRGAGSGGGGDRTVGDGAGGTGLILSPGDFSIVLRAVETLNKGRSVSMPRLLVTNNQQATLDSTLDQPFATTTQPTSGGVVTAFGGSSQAGTQVTLKPQIAEGDHLTLDYSVSLSAFTGAAAGSNVPPPKQQNKVQSVASLPDGHTVAVGGIELATDGDGQSRVPLLGQIPIVGEAFKSRSRNHGRTRFFVFIRSNILRHQSFEDLKYLSELTTGQAGVDDGWPAVEPRVMR